MSHPLQEFFSESSEVISSSPKSHPLSEFFSETEIQEEPNKSAYKEYVEEPGQIFGSNVAAGLRSFPRTAFDLVKTVAKKAGGDVSKLEEAQENAPEWLKAIGRNFAPTFEEVRKRQLKEGSPKEDTAFKRGLGKAGRFFGEAPYFGGIGGVKGALGIFGAATGAQVGEELELNPIAQGALTLGGGVLGHGVGGGIKGASKQKITPEVESYMQASKELGIDPLLTGMNPNQIQKVAQKWATHGIGGPEMLQDAYKRRSDQVSKAFSKAMDEAGENLLREPVEAGEALKEGITEATKQIEHTKSQLYRAVDKTLPAGATIKVANTPQIQIDINKAIGSLEDSLALAPKETPVYSRMQKLQRNLEELLEFNDGEIPIKNLEGTQRSLHEVIRYDRPGGADKLLIPVAKEIGKELDRYGKLNVRYDTARKAANDYFRNDVVHIRQNLLQSIARSERPESTLATMNTVSGIRNVERALKALPDGKRLFESLRRYKLQSMLQDKLIDQSTGLMKVDGLKSFLSRKTDNYSVIKELAGNDGIRTLKLLEESGKGLERGFNNLVNPSRTADTLIAIKSVLSPFQKIGGGITKLLRANLGEGAIETLGGLAQVIAPKAVSRIVLDPEFANKVFMLSKAAKKNDWKAFNRLLDSIDSELKKDNDRYQEFLEQ